VYVSDLSIVAKDRLANFLFHLPTHAQQGYEARTAPILGFAVFVTVIFLGSVLSVIYVRIKQRAIVERRRNMAMAMAAEMAPTFLPGMEPSAPDLPPSYEDVVAANTKGPGPSSGAGAGDEEDPPHYKSLETSYSPRTL
jgi:hypothetical protein